MQVVRNRLMGVSCLPSMLRGMPESGLLPMAMSGSVVLPQLESVFTSMTHVLLKALGMAWVWAAICGHVGFQGLWHC